LWLTKTKTKFYRVHKLFSHRHGQQAKYHKESRPSDASKQEVTEINNHARKKNKIISKWMVQNSPSLARIVVSIMDLGTADNSLTDSGYRHVEVGDSAPHNFALQNNREWQGRQMVQTWPVVIMTIDDETIHGKKEASENLTSKWYLWAAFCKPLALSAWPPPKVKGMPWLRFSQTKYGERHRAIRTSIFHYFLSFSFSIVNQLTNTTWDLQWRDDSLSSSRKSKYAFFPSLLHH